MTDDMILINKEIGDRLRRARLLNNFTQTDLATPLNKSFQQIQKYEQGTNRVSAVNVHRLARILGLSVTYFYDGLEKTFLTDYEESRNLPLPDSAVFAARSLEQMEDSQVKDRMYDLIRAISRAI